MKKKIFLLIFLFSMVNLFSMEITLQEAIERGIIENVEVRNEKIDHQNTEILKKQAVKKFLPNVGIQSTYTRAENPLISDNPDSDNMYGNKISIDQPIFTGGKILIGIESANLLEEKGEFSLNKKIKDGNLEITESYITILKLKKNKEILEKSLTQLEETYKMVTAQYRLNLITKAPVLEIDYTMTNLESQLLELEKGIKISKSNLKRLIGINSTEKIELKDILIDPNTNEEYDLESNIKEAIENGTDASLIKMTSRFQEMNVKLEKSNLYPTVGFNFSLENSATELDRVSKEEWGWTGTIAFSYDIFDFGYKKDNYKRIKNDLKVSKNNEENTLKNLEIGIRNSYYELIISKKVIIAKEKALESSKEQYDLEKGRHEAGIITTTDFLQSENNLRQAEINLINSKLDYYLAKKTYENKIK